MAAWNTAALRSYLRESKGGSESFELIWSIEHASRLFEFYKCEALRALELGWQPADESANIENVIRVFEYGDEDQEAALQVEAHVMGCVNTVRSAFDFLATLINCHVLPVPVVKKRLYVDDVWRRVPPGLVRDALTTVSSSEAYAYIVAYSNTSKHRRIVKFGRWVDFQNNRAGLGPTEFGACEAPRHSHRTAREVLGYCVELWNGVVSTGIAINQHLCIHSETNVTRS
jgi:hypothetical protein